MSLAVEHRVVPTREIIPKFCGFLRWLFVSAVAVLSSPGGTSCRSSDRGMLLTAKGLGRL